MSDAFVSSVPKMQGYGIDVHYVAFSFNPVKTLGFAFCRIPLRSAGDSCCHLPRICESRDRSKDQ